MLNLLKTIQDLFSRGISFSVEDYYFCLNCVFGEDELVSYALAYDTAEFKKVLGTEMEEKYLNTKKQECESLKTQQHIIKLRQELDDLFVVEIQNKALNLQNYRFTGGQIAQILQNLLHNRVADLDSASTKDVISLIKLLTEQFGLESGSDFEKHFIQIYPKFNALCTNCNKEFQVSEGLGAVCPNCKATYKWDNSLERFIPQPAKL